MAAGGDPKQLALWAATWTGVDPDPAIDAVEAHLPTLSDAKKRTVFTMSYVTYLLGDRHMSSRLDRVTLQGNVELTRDRRGLALARELHAVLGATLKALEADKALPEAVDILAPRSVKNPFG